MIEILQATPKDIPDILRMMRQLCAFHGDTCVLGLAQAQQQLIETSSRTAFVGRRDQRSLGYAVVEAKWNPTMHAQPYEIAHLYVVEQQRGLGIGRALIDEARAFARDVGAGQLKIGTSPINPGAAAAYRAMGLTEIPNQPGSRFDVGL